MTPASPDPGSFLPLPNLPFQIMLALAEEPRHGWAIVKRLEEMNGDRGLPSSGSLYLALARLEERKLIEAVPEGSPAAAAAKADERRRIYRLTLLGRRVVKLESARLAELVGIARRSLGPLGRA